MIEVESKVQVVGSVADELARVRQRLRDYPGVEPKVDLYTTYDAYFGYDDRDILYRRRTSSAEAQTLINTKERQRDKGVEINIEREADYSGPLGVILRRLEADKTVTLRYVKQKHGRRFQYLGVSVEIVEVTVCREGGAFFETLGTFIEVEKLLPVTADDKEIAQAKAEVMHVLEHIGYGPEYLCHKGYLSLYDAACGHHTPGTIEHKLKSIPFKEKLGTFLLLGAILIGALANGFLIHAPL